MLHSSAAAMRIYVAKAAARLYVSHSAISRQIKLLEDELQAMLFVRKGRHVSLTAAGKALLGYAERVLENIRRSFPNVSVLTTTGNADEIIEEIRSTTIDVGVVSLPVDALWPIIAEFHSSLSGELKQRTGSGCCAYPVIESTEMLRLCARHWAGMCPSTWRTLSTSAGNT